MRLYEPHHRYYGETDMEYFVRVMKETNPDLYHRCMIPKRDKNGSFVCDEHGEPLAEWNALDSPYKEDCRTAKSLYDDLMSRKDIVPIAPPGHEYDYLRAAPRMPPSRVFVPGQKVDRTLLTVIGPGWLRTNKSGNQTWTWKEVHCKCECGNEINVPYESLNALRPKYSCGCSRRGPSGPKAQGKPDFSGTTVTNTELTSHQTRSLIVLYLDTTVNRDQPFWPGQWVYTCDCCGDTFHLENPQPRRAATLVSRLREIIQRAPCPNRNRLREIIQRARKGQEMTADEALERM